MRGIVRSTEFGQSDPTDGRKRYCWESRYPPKAKSEIRIEACYLASLIALSPILMWVVSQHVPNGVWSRLDPAARNNATSYALAWLGGTLGGTLFASKWLYHSVARGWWNLDRRLWRLFTPHISGALAFAILVLIASGLTRILDPRAITSRSVVVGLSFLAGYFSDGAVAKLTELANTLFGSPKEPSASNKEKGTDSGSYASEVSAGSD